MKDDVCVRKLLELIFVKEFRITAELTAPDSNFPACLLINDFSLKLRRIFWTRQVIVGLKLPQGAETLTWDSLTTQEELVKSIIFNCITENYCHQKVFDSFISVCSLLRYFSIETFHKKGVDLSDLSLDIMMEFYENVLKRSFRKCGGFQRLVEYIHHHEYLAWNLDMNHLADPLAPPDDGTKKKLLDVINKEIKILTKFRPSTGIAMAAAYTLAEKVLLNTSVELPTLPIVEDSNRSVDASGSNDKATTADGKRKAEADLKFEPMDKVSQECSNSDSKMNSAVKQKEDIGRHERIIQAVMRYNQSRTSVVVTSDNSLQKKADGILKHLKDTIESLIDVLDEYDNE